jgi:hypothetical protein
MGGRRSTELMAVLNARAYADSGGARADADTSRARAYVTKGRTVWCSAVEPM